MNSNIEFLLKDVCSRLERMELKLNKLETIEKSVLTLETKMSNMEGYMLGMKTYMNKVKQEVQEVSEEVHGIKFVVEVHGMKFDVSEVEDSYKLTRQENQKLKNDIVDIQARFMRDNLVFVGINEFQNETPDKTEAILLEFLVNDLKMSQEDADVIKFDRVHRTGSLEKKPRPIIAILAEYKQREKVRFMAPNLEGTHFYINVQYPPEIITERKKLYPIFKKNKDEGQNVRMVYNKLYINNVLYKPRGSVES
ncbi:unnamed protein product [Mytilus coruscus]|uniref:Uncharacterized protein n=1 Tax=Mytilus coruscus TaxID=42192 RepID=A0A6J8B2V9_MYTCO|nr:unnamed protein product [Mytilus coruscus]